MRFEKTMEYEGRKWNKVRGSGRDGVLSKGEVLMTPRTEEEALSPDNVLFSICTGTGFGVRTETSGRGIYVQYERRTLDEVLAHEGDGYDNARWEADWTIYRLMDGDVPVTVELEG